MKPLAFLIIQKPIIVSSYSAVLFMKQIMPFPCEAGFLPKVSNCIPDLGSIRLASGRRNKDSRSQSFIKTNFYRQKPVIWPRFAELRRLYSKLRLYAHAKASN